jgi:integrase/recombinase XerD
MDIRGFLKTIEGLADNTQRCYEQSLWQLNTVIKDKEPTTDEIYAFLKNYGASTLQRHKAAIKAYWEYRWPEAKWPFTRRHFAQKRQRVPRYISTETVQEIMDAGENEDEKMFVETLFQLGCRISELMSIEDHNLTPAGVRVITKGGNENLKLTTKEFNQKLQTYANKKHGKLFPKPYTYFDQLLKRMAAKAGHSGVSCHMLRHGRAVDLLRKGMKISDLQQFLGHASIMTTAIYLQITGGELAKQLEKVEANGSAVS